MATGRKIAGAKVAVDVAMGAVLVALMATALLQEVPHEWLGMALFALVTAHIVLNRRWMASVPRIRPNAARVLQLVVLAGLILCIAGDVVSSLVISKHVFRFLPAFAGTAVARRVHMLCTYWTFVLAFAHAGLHARLPKARTPRGAWARRVGIAVATCYGAYSFAKLDLLSYLTGRVQFAFVDFGTSLALTTARYASVAALVMVVFQGIRRGLMAAKLGTRHT